MESENAVSVFEIETKKEEFASNMEQYTVTGMSCAACSSRVEKAVSKVPGVTSCSVSLLTNSMGVEGTASAADIISAVQEAGYGALLKGAGKDGAVKAQALDAEEALKDHETPVLKRRLWYSLGFLIVLMYFSMGHMMWGLAASEVFRWKSCGHGTDPVDLNCHCHGHQPEILSQRI